MTTAKLPSPPASTRAPDPDRVFDHADRRIAAAAAALWPDARIELGLHVPSPTTYVRRMWVDGRHVYAKHSFLGMSLVSLLRGVAGDWSQVQAAQELYVQRPDSLMRREAAQLAFLSRLPGPRSDVFAGLHDATLFTTTATGTPLSQALLANPADSTDLLDLAFSELRPLHGRDPRVTDPGVIGTDRSITSTFARKFGQPGARTYIDELAASHERAQLAPTLHRVVHRLLAASLSAPTLRRSICYGDLKPEHVIFPAGPDQRPVFIDPGLTIASPDSDRAKLISRTVLLLAAVRPAGAGQIIDGLGRHVDHYLARTTRVLQPAILRQLLTWWLMDTTSILTTYLAAPYGLPLPHTGLALTVRAPVILTMVDAVAGQLEQRLPAHQVWDNALAAAKAVAAS
ncbi:phosphotransferase [Streptomyces sp. NPDC058290]|uniref:phosphotransferase n=1 Tax=Streptomyces sp. NPDC058290 TaxID=3346426 RepID=UPI0036E770E3